MSGPEDFAALALLIVCIFILILMYRPKQD